jgi:hypothetical protein
MKSESNSDGTAASATVYAQPMFVKYWLLHSPKFDFTVGANSKNKRWSVCPMMAYAHKIAKGEVASPSSSWGERRGEVASSSSSSSSHKDDNVGQRGGPGGNDDNCGMNGRVVVMSFRCEGKDSGKEDDDVNEVDCGGRGGRVFVVFVVVVVSDPG